jgi:hypothetical protein
MTHTSMTTISLHGDMSVARRYVKKMLELVALFTLAECPAEVNSTTFDRERNVVHMAICDIQAFYEHTWASGMTFSLPSYKTPMSTRGGRSRPLRKHRNTSGDLRTKKVVATI